MTEHTKELIASLLHTLITTSGLLGAVAILAKSVKEGQETEKSGKKGAKMNDVK